MNKISVLFLFFLIWAGLLCTEKFQSFPFQIYYLLFMFLLGGVLSFRRNLVSQKIFFIFLICILAIGQVISTIHIPTHAKDANEALSRSTYNGVSNLTPTITWLFFMLWTLFIGGYLLIGAKNKINSLQKNTTKDYPGENLRQDTKSFDAVVVALGVIALNPLSLASINGLRHPVFSNGFDGGQYWVWLLFKSRGFMPMVDFWFPYNGLIYFEDGILGLILRWLALSLSFVMMLSILRRVKMSRVGLSLILVVYAYMLNSYWITAIRYAFPVLALLYLTLYLLDRTCKYRKGTVLHSIPLALSIWISPEVSLFVSILFIIVLSIQFRLNLTAKQNILTSFIFVGTSMMVQVAILFKNHSLENLIDLLFKPSETISYAYSINEASTTNFLTGRQSDFLLHAEIVVTLITGLVLVRARNMKRLNYANNIAGIFTYVITSVYIMWLYEKDLVRGWMVQPITFTIFPMIIFFIQFSDSSILLKQKSFNLKKFLQGIQLSSSIIVIALSAAIITDSNFTDFISKPIKAPNEQLRTFRELMHRQNRSIFVHSDFTKTDDSATLGNEIFTAHPDVAKNGLYVLGDVPSVSLHIAEPPYWTSSIWNSSPFSVQKRIVDQLIVRKPENIIIDRRPETLDFDGTPSILRIPLIYKYIAENYRITHVSQNYSLAVLTKGKARDYDGWSSVLGNSVDLGKIPQSVSEPLMCTSSSCSTFLQMSKVKTPLKIGINCDKSTFEISIPRLLGNQLHYFPIDRLWFWNNKCKLANNLDSSIKLVSGKSPNGLY